MHNIPIKLSDVFGDVPTPREAAAMAAHVYGDKKDNILVGGWKMSTKDFGIKKNSSENGLKSQVYERMSKNGKMEYAYATAGTEASSKDIGADLKQPLGLSKQYDLSMKNAAILDKKLKNRELTFVGHSLGGGEAAANAKVTGRSAITFNAAGVSVFTTSKKTTRIDAFMMVTDPLNLTQNNNLCGLGALMPDLNGNRIPLFPTDKSSIYNGHSMDNVLKNFGFNPLKYAIPPAKVLPTPNIFERALLSVPTFTPTFNF